MAGSNGKTEKAGDYTITNSMEIGSKRFVIGRNDNLAEPYLVAGYRTKIDGIFAEYYDVLVSDDYMEILEEYIKRQTDECHAIKEQRQQRGSDGMVFGVQDCIPNSRKTDYTNRIVVVAADTLKPEFRTKDNQLVLALGGFGTRPDCLGSKLYVRDCWAGENYHIRREDVLGIISPDKTPKWAKENAAIFLAQSEKQTQQTEELERGIE